MNKEENVEVHVWDLDGKYIGKGVMVNEKDPAKIPEDCRTTLYEFFGTPKITMKDGKVIFGAQCWWKETKDCKTIPKQLDFKPMQQALEVTLKAIDNVFGKKQTDGSKQK